MSACSMPKLLGVDELLRSVGKLKRTDNHRSAEGETLAGVGGFESDSFEIRRS